MRSCFRFCSMRIWTILLESFFREGCREWHAASVIDTLNKSIGAENRVHVYAQN